MKIFVLLFLAALVAISAAAPQSLATEDAAWGPLYIDGTPCPAKFFKSECNSCFCLDNGISAGCTLMACEQE